MLGSRGQPQTFSDATIRRFLLARLSANEQSAFEEALLSSSHLEQRVRQAEIELVDDHAADRLKANERAAFRQKFLVTSEREKKLAVSIALRDRLSDSESQSVRWPAKRSFSWPRLAWRVALAGVALVIVLASVLVIRREPTLVKRIIPKQLRPAAVRTPAAQSAHHPADSSESTTHREGLPALPGHEAGPQTVVLHANVTADSAPVVALAQSGAQVVRIELMLERSESKTFGIVVTTTSGEIVHNIPAIRIDNADRIDFDVAFERLKAGDYHVTLTRLHDEPATTMTTYYFRVQ